MPTLYHFSGKMSRSAEENPGKAAHFRLFSRESGGKMGLEVEPMKKELLLSFLAGLVLPVVLALAFQRTRRWGMWKATR